jgi:5-methylcytosine-specific restriction endonuclease McrA
MAFKKGNKPWNKGNTGAQTAWNKGKKQWATKRHPRLGAVVSAETREKLRHAALGKKYHLGHKHTEEAKRKVSVANTGRVRTPEHCAAISKAQKGNTHAWKNGNTPIRLKIWRSEEYRLWRTAVFERDDYTCQHCGTSNGNGITVTLNADHIKPFALYPELRFDVSNGQTLCVSCHRKTPTYGGRTRTKQILQVNH